MKFEFEGLSKDLWKLADYPDVKNLINCEIFIHFQLDDKAVLEFCSSKNQRMKQ